MNLNSTYKLLFEDDKVTIEHELDSYNNAYRVTGKNNQNSYDLLNAFRTFKDIQDRDIPHFKVTRSGDLNHLIVMPKEDDEQPIPRKRRKKDAPSNIFSNH
jgi:hypothetical protein